MTTNNPKVFIHYSWDSENHRDWTLFLAQRLVADGVDVYFDMFDLQLGANTTYFMERISEADKIIIIGTETYKGRAEQRKGGVGYEFQIISNEISKVQTRNNRFLPVLRQGKRESSLPSFLQSFLYLDMTNDKYFEESYIQLLRSVYDEHKNVKPSLGKKPDFEKLEKAVNKSKTNTNSLDLLFKLGITRNKVHKLLGTPQEEARLYESYWSHGIQVYYNRHWDKVDGVLAKRLPSGVAYDGEIAGVKLNDSFAEVKSKLGNPINWGLPDIYTSFAFYRLQKKYLTIALWRDKPEKELVDFKIGSVNAICYCEEHSIMACEPIVAVAIEEIRAGKIPSHLEDSDFATSSIDLNAEFFSEPYDIFPTQFGQFGGYFVTVIFKLSETVLDFWLYDLMWSTFVIRNISVREREATETFVSS